MRCSLDEANKSIELIERRTHEEYDSSEEKISAMLAKIKTDMKWSFKSLRKSRRPLTKTGYRIVLLLLSLQVLF